MAPAESQQGPRSSVIRRVTDCAINNAGEELPVARARIVHRGPAFSGAAEAGVFNPRESGSGLLPSAARADANAESRDERCFERASRYRFEASVI